MLLPKQHLNRPEPLNSSELRGECRRCLPIGCSFYLESLGKRPAAGKGHRSFPGRGRSPAPDRLGASWVERAGRGRGARGA